MKRVTLQNSPRHMNSQSDIVFLNIFFSVTFASRRLLPATFLFYFYFINLPRNVTNSLLHTFGSHRLFFSSTLNTLMSLSQISPSSVTREKAELKAGNVV